MIQREGKHDFALICDICSEPTEENFEDFWQAVKFKQNNGWKSQKRDGEWEDVCPECQAGNEEKLAGDSNA